VCRPAVGVVRVVRAVLEVREVLGRFQGLAVAQHPKPLEPPEPSVNHSHLLNPSNLSNDRV
jgi:hypothetical protein